MIFNKYFWTNLIVVLLISFKGLAQPANDLCAGASSLTLGGACVNGTNVAATDNVNNPSCHPGSPGSHEDVWYSFVATGTQFDATFTAGTMAGNVEYALISGTCAALVEEDCQVGASPLTVTTTGLTIGATYYVLVSNGGADANGTFTICNYNTTTPAAGCALTSDDCAAPVINTAGISSQICQASCNTGNASGPDFAGNNCYDFPNATTWFQVTAPVGSAQLDIDITSATLTNPYYTVFTAAGCSSGLWTIVDCFDTGAAGSISGISNVTPGTTYLIAVSDENGLEGTFNFCANFLPDASLCNTDDDLVESASSDPSTPVGGPYSPGEVVTFCYTINQYMKEQCNWLQGVVPSFGDCWSPSSFNANGSPVTVTTPLVQAGNNTGVWSWWANGTVQYNAGHPQAGQNVGAGWFFVLTAQGSDPDVTYGDGGAPGPPSADCDPAGNGYTWSVCFQLIAGPTSNCSNGTTDCGLTINTVADGEVGIWGNNGCNADTDYDYNAGFLCCTPPVITPVSNQTICSNTAINVSLTSDQDPGVTYSWTVVAGADITGAIAGSGTTINQTLVNSGLSAQTAVYTVTANNGSCSSITTFTITVNPTNTITAGSNQTVCINSPITNITMNTTIATGATFSGLPAGVTGSWAANTATISGTPTASGTFNYTVTTTGGCPPATTTGTITVNPLNTITAGSNQTLCVNSALTNITMTTTGATGATFSGLPAGVTGAWAGNTVTISGTPTASGTFNYTVTTTGGCPPATATGTITVTPLNTITAGSNQTVCINTAMTNITMTTTGATGATFSGLPAGVSGAWAGNTVTISGIPIASGTFNYTVTTTGGCPPATATGTITVTPQNTITAGSNQTVCINSALTNITMTTTGATGATFSGLPAGVTGAWAGNTVTISGTPTASGTFNYTVTTTGGCPPATATGTITVTPLNTITAGSNQTVCINSALTDITMTTTGATGATFSGLPAGVTGAWAGNTVTISGTPTVSGTFNYTVTTTGGCPPATTTGTITVTPLNTITAGSNQTVCINSAITNITMTTTGATGATFSGLPAGVTGAWAGNVVTISGTPTASGTFNYTVTTTGGCPPATATGTITVTPQNTITAGSNQTVCINSALTNITMTTTGATGATFSGLPAGVTGSWAANTVTISGTPTASGTFNYTVTTTGGCPPATTTGTITVTPLNTIAAGTSETVCINSPITTINLATTGATGATFSGLPAGVSGSWAGNVATISGTPTASGTFNYTVTTTGGCPPATATGTITVTPQNTITAGSNQTVCINTAMTNITMTTTGATGATFSGLPAGVSGAWAGNTVTIFGTPTASGTFNYTVTTTGGCPPATATGTITVVDIPVISLTPTDPTVCNGTDGSISVSGSGTGTIFWSGTASGSQAVAGFPSVITNLGSGSYDVYFVNSTGCQSSTVTTSLNNPGAPVINPISNVNNCGTNYTLVAITGTSLNNPQYYTLPGGPSGGGVVVPVGTVYSAPTNTILYAYDENGVCNSQQSFTIVINTLPTVSSVTGGATYCAGDVIAPISVAVTGTANWSIAYTIDGIAQVPVSSATSPISLGTAPGVYVVTNITDANCTNTASGTQTITINALPTVTGVTGGGVYCAGDVVAPISVSVTGAANWSIGYTLNGVAQVPATGATSPITLGNAAGTYVVTSVTDANCTNSATGTQTITINALPTVTSVTGGAVYCAGDVIAPINVNVTGAANWSVDYTLNGIAQTAVTGASSPISLGNAPGVYVVTNITDANCTNTASGTQTITINALPTVTGVSGGAIYCAGSPVSPITVSATGAANWSVGFTLNGVAQVPATGATSPISLGSAAGTYVVTSVTDANCTNTAAGTQTITINPLPTVTSVTGGAIYCTGSPIAPINVAVTGTPNWSIAYTLDGVAQTAVTGGSSPLSLGTAPGVYVVTNVSDANCTNTASGTQTIVINALPTVTGVTGGAVYCSGDVIAPINAAVTGAANWSVSYTLDGVAQTPATGGSSPISLGTAAGVYVVTSVTDANCTNSASGTQTITVNALPTASISGGATYCTGDVVSNISVAATGSPSWTVNYTFNGTPSALTGGTSPISLGNTAGTYILTGISDALCTNTATGTETITINTLPTATISGGAIYCTGDVIANVNVAVTGAANWTVDYTLNGTPLSATGSSSPISLGNAAGTYVLTGITDALCTNTASGTQTITVNPLPTATISGGATYCAGDVVSDVTVAVTGTANWTVNYTLDGTPLSAIGSSSPISLGNAAGVYVLTGVTDALCSNTASGTQTITVNPLPTFTLAGTDPTVCNATDGIITISGLLNNTAYDVSYNAVAAANYTSSATGTITISGLSAGSYNNFVVTLTSSGCIGSSASTVTLNNPGAPVINDIVDQTVCDTYTLPTITGSLLTGNEAYWTGTGGTGTQLAVGSAITSSQTIYIYDFSGSCFDEESFIITVNNTPTITNPGNATVCATYTLPTINGTNLSGNEAYYTNSQALGGTVITGPITSTQTIWIYDVEGSCSDEESFLVTINPLPTVTNVSGQGTYCAGDVVNPILVDVTGTANWTIDYTLDGVAQTATGAASPISLGNAAGVYVITDVTDATCTNSATGTQTITINAIPAAPTAGTDTTYCSSWEYVAMTAVGAGGTYTWYSDAGLTSTLGTGGSLMPTDVVGTTVYYVTETMNTCEGPASTVTIVIEDCEIIVPTAFTPDGDNVNDYWEILDLDAVYPNNIVMVYNRWGSLLYQSEEGKYSSNPWKGDYKGAELPVGSYYFIIDFQDEKVEPQKGIVSIILNK